MAPVFSKVAARNSALIAASVGIVYWVATVRLKRGRKRAELVDEVACAYAQKDEKRVKVQVDANFFRQLRAILKIILPSVFTFEFAYVLMIAVTLVGRTLCDIYMIHNGTIIERAIITQDISLFRKSLEAFIFAMPMPPKRQKQK